MRNNPLMRAAFERDFEIKWQGASPQMQLAYARGFVAGKESNPVKTTAVDLDLTASHPAYKAP